MLKTLGLAELVTATLADYESRAVALALSRERLNGLRERLNRSGETSGLFDTDRFRRHLEYAYLQMLDIQDRGDPPRQFAVPPIER